MADRETLRRMLSVRDMATIGLDELSRLVADLPIRTEIVPRSGNAVYAFYEATTAAGLRVAVSLERYGPGERIYFEVRREGPMSVWFDLSRADVERPLDEFTKLYIRPAMTRIAKCLRDQVTSTAPSIGVPLGTAAEREVVGVAKRL